MIATLDRHGSRVALAAVVLLPILLIVARPVAQAVIAAIAAGFVLRCVLLWDFSPGRQLWFRVAMAYWAWQVLTTLLAGAETTQLLDALAWARLPVAILALGSWVLAEERARRWLLYGTGAAMVWIAVEVWLQLLVGRGLSGPKRWPGTELTGPFDRPRAGPFLAMGMWAPLLAAAGAWASRPGLAWQAAAWALIGFAFATLVFIGQRIPLVLGVVGMLLAAAMLPALRRPAFVALATAAAALAAASVVAPATFHRLVVQFSRQLIGFPESHYGQILARALEMARQHPLFGLGESGFGARCRDAAYHVGWTAGSDGGGAGICTTHAHNHYLQALTDAGYPGLILFTAMIVLLLAALARGLLRRPTPLRVALFVATFLPMWPIASSANFVSLPGAGLWLLAAGWGLAEARAAAREAEARDGTG